MTILTIAPEDHSFRSIGESGPESRHVWLSQGQQAGFLLRLPDVQRLATSLPVAIQTPMVPLTTAVPRLVLIADGNDRTHAARAEQLTAVGLRVARARTSFEAIVKASCHVPDCILLDGSLTDLNTADTLQLLLTCPVTKDIPIFRLTPGRRVPARVVAATLGSRI